jgi:SOS regulatory protein LexA
MLTRRQKQILDYIKKYLKENDYAPSLEETRRHFRLSSIATIHQHIETLREKGYLKKIENQPRSIELNKKRRISDLISIPLLGTIAAGEPIEAIEDKETIEVPKSQLSKSGEHFALRVSGDSMIDEGIFNGDTIVIRKQPTAENGETVVALLNGNEVTLKKIYKERNGFRLQPANPNLKPIFTKELEVQGKVVSVIRSFEELKEKVIPQKQEKTQTQEGKILKEKVKKIDIHFKKTCDCPPNHINCLTAKNWMKSQVAVWEFAYEKRDIRDKNIHPAVFPIGLPSKCIELFTHKGELVLDPFVGIGTTLIAARDLERNAIGFDLNKKYINFTEKRLSQSNLFSSAKHLTICDDAINIPNYLEENSVSLSVTSPPYANMLNRPRENKSLRGNLRNNQHYKKIQQYSKNPRDLGTMEPKKFAQALGEIYKEILTLHKPRAHCVVNITDLWWENKRIPLHLYIIEALQKAGYELRNTIIWDRRNLVNRAGIFGWPNNYITLGTTLEYILDFWRPK